MKKLSKRDKKVIRIGTVAAAVILAAFYIVLPFVDAQEAGIQKLRNKEKMLQQSIHTIQEKELHQSKLQQLEASLGRYRQNLLDAPDPSTARIQLEETVRNLAAQNGVSLTRSNPVQEIKIGERYSKITLQINLESNMTQLTSFLYSLASHQKFLLAEEFYLASFRTQNDIRIQPRLNVSGFIRLS